MNDGETCGKYTQIDRNAQYILNTIYPCSYRNILAYVSAVRGLSIKVIDKYIYNNRYWYIIVSIIYICLYFAIFISFLAYFSCCLARSLSFISGGFFWQNILLLIWLNCRFFPTLRSARSTTRVGSRRLKRAEAGAVAVDSTRQWTYSTCSLAEGILSAEEAVVAADQGT